MARAQAGDGPPDEPPTLAGLRVLVVDDNATSRRILERQLCSWRMSCEVADGAARAMELLESAAGAGMPFALVLLDLNMPHVDGYELAGGHARHPRPARHAPRPAQLLGRSLRRPGGGGSRRRARQAGAPVAALRGDPGGHRRRAPGRCAGRGLRAAGAPRRGAIPAVLVVEDTPINQAVAAHMLERCGFAAQVAENGRQALEALSRRTYAAVLMDCQMPELDGYETTREIRRLEQGGAAHADHRDDGQRDAGRARALPRRRHGRLPDQAAATAHAQGRPVALGHGTGHAVERPPARSDERRAARRGAGADPQVLDEAIVLELEALDGDVLGDLVALYFDDAAQRAADLVDAVARADPDAVARMAHTLKGSSSTLGAAQVAHIASELEQAAKAGDLAPAAALLESLHLALEETRKAFRDRTAEPNNDGVFPL